jgi:hypothetical protein
MSSGPPKTFAINHDNYHAKYVGRTSDGRQFFLTTPFIGVIRGQAGCEYLALFICDRKGSLIEAKIDDLGPRAGVDKNAFSELRDQRIKELGKISFQRIEIAPFKVERFGQEFGLIPRPPEDDEDGSWWVEVLPGNCMAFHEPWDSGEYDT